MLQACDGLFCSIFATYDGTVLLRSGSTNKLENKRNVQYKHFFNYLTLCVSSICSCNAYIYLCEFYMQ